MPPNNDDELVGPSLRAVSQIVLQVNVMAWTGVGPGSNKLMTLLGCVDVSKRTI